MKTIRVSVIVIEIAIVLDNDNDNSNDDFTSGTRYERRTNEIDDVSDDNNSNSLIYNDDNI